MLKSLLGELFILIRGSKLRILPKGNVKKNLCYLQLMKCYTVI